MNSAVWQHCVELLPEWIDAIMVDLPGHGGMRQAKAESLDDYVQVIAAVVNRPVIWVGWSLGGLVTLRLAEMYPERVAGLFQVATTPGFTQRTAWRTAVGIDVFEQFSALLMKDVNKTINRFMALQMLGVKSARELVQKLQQAIQCKGLPAEQALHAGLNVLMQSDLRESVVALQRPTKWYLGEKDQLVPSDLATALHALNPAIDVTVQAGAGHAPFVSHPDEFVDTLLGFIRACTARHTHE